MSSTRKVAAAVAVAAVVTAVCAACSSSGGSTAGQSSGDTTGGSGMTPSGSPLNVGVVVAQTGYLGGVDPYYLEGIQSAAEKLNSSGGAGGHKISLHVYDNASSATTGVSMVNKAINQDHATALITGALSAQNAAIAQTLASRHIPNLTGAQLPSDPSWSFETSDGYQLDVNTALNYAHSLNAKSIAVLATQTPFGQLCIGYIAKQAPALGIKIVLSDTVDATSTDLTAEMSKVKAAKPDALIDFITGGIQVVAAKGATAVGLSIPIVMSEDELATLKQASSDYAKAVFAAPPPELYPNIPSAQAAITGPFVTAYKAKHADLAGISFAAEGYDAMMMLAAAVKNAHSTSGSAIRTALESLNTVGVYGTRHYTSSDHYGQPADTAALAIAKLSGGEVVRVQPTK